MNIPSPPYHDMRNKRHVFNFPCRKLDNSHNLTHVFSGIIWEEQWGIEFAIKKYPFFSVGSLPRLSHWSAVDRNGQLASHTTTAKKIEYAQAFKKKHRKASNRNSKLLIWKTNFYFSSLFKKLFLMKANVILKFRTTRRLFMFIL